VIRPRRSDRSTVNSQLETYFLQIRDTPLLSGEEERALARRIAEGDREARNQLVQANLRLVVSVARRFSGKGLCLQDLIEEGNLGLLKAVERFDPTRGIRFSTYATYWIKQSIRLALINTAKAIRVPAHTMALVSQWNQATHDLQVELGRPATPDEITRRLKLRPQQRERLDKALRAQETASTPLDDDGNSALDELLVDHRTESPEQTTLEAEACELLYSLLDELEEREATVLRLRFGLRSEEPTTLRTIGQRLGLTYERVRQIESRALSKLSQRMAAAG
jgi:RNA polymerase primary sigma factor